MEKACYVVVPKCLMHHCKGGPDLNNYHKTFFLKKKRQTFAIK